MMFFLWFRPLSNPAWYGLIVTIHIHDSIYSKKNGRWTKILSFVLKCVQIISRTRSFAWNLDDFSRRHCKANIRKFNRGVQTEIYGVFKVKNRKKFNQQVQNVTGPESKHLQLPEPIVVYDKLGRELEHFNWALFSVLSPKAIQILYSQFANLCTLKPKRIKLARYV